MPASPLDASTLSRPIRWPAIALDVVRRPEIGGATPLWALEFELQGDYPDSTRPNPQHLRRETT